MNLPAELASSPALDGVSLKGFSAFIDSHGGRAAFRDLTTAAIKDLFVLPATAALRCAYAELLRLSPGCVGKATAFLSHVYSGTFVDAVDAAAAWEARIDGG
jgi:hypothetical protein